MALKPVKARIKKWVEALRRGRYKQGTGSLRTRTEYCCLGVACSVSRLGRWSEDKEYVAGETRDYSILPKAVAEWYGIDRDPQLTQYARASEANDNLGWSFSEIADAVEKKYLKRSKKNGTSARGRRR